MGKPTGFLEYERETSTAEAPLRGSNISMSLKLP